MNVTARGSPRRLALVLAGAATLALARGLTAEPLRLGHAPSLKAALDVVALEQGYFAREGLEVELVQVPSGNAALARLVAGELDVSESTLYPVVLGSFSNDGFRIFATESVSRNDNLIVARTDRGVRSIRDLAGKTVGVLDGGNPEFVLGLILMNGGLAADRVTVVKGDMASLLARFAAGGLDAYACFGAWVDKARAAWPGRTVTLVDEDIVRIAMPLVARADDLERNPERYRKLIRALVRAEAYLRKNPEKAFEMTVRHFGMDAAEARPLWHPDVFGVRLDQSMIRDMENMARWQMDAGYAPGAAMPDVLDLFDFRPLEAVDRKRVTIIH